MEKSPDSVIELNVHMVGGKMYFQISFCTLGPCTQGFRGDCRPYLSVDSTTLNGRSMYSACSEDFLCTWTMYSACSLPYNSTTIPKC
jgi:hypothetical protein